MDSAPLYAAGYRLDRAILGYAPASVPPLKWQRMLHNDFWVTFRGPGFEPRLMSFLLGTSLIAAAVAFAAYFLCARVSPASTTGGTRVSLPCVRHGGANKGVPRGPRARPRARPPHDRRALTSEGEARRSSSRGPQARGIPIESAKN